MIQANLPPIAVALFDPSLREAMLSVRFRFDCSHGRCRISKYAGWMRDGSLPVEAMIDLGVRLADRISALVAAGAIPRAAVPRRHAPKQKGMSAGVLLGGVALLLLALGACAGIVWLAR